MACHVVKMRIHSAKNSITSSLSEQLGHYRSSKCSVVYVIISESPETRWVSISIRAISMHKIESREISNRIYLSKTILACRERQANKTRISHCLSDASTTFNPIGSPSQDCLPYLPYSTLKKCCC